MSARAQVAALLWTAFGIGLVVTSFRSVSATGILTSPTARPPQRSRSEPMGHGRVTTTPRRAGWAATASLLVMALSACSPGLHAAAPRASSTQVAGPGGPGLTGPVGPIARSCHGVAITAADNVQQAIGAHPAGTTFCLAAGTYRLASPLVPKLGDALIGHRGAVLNGSKVLTGWRKSGKLWWTRGFLPPAPSTHGECLPAAPLCTHTQDVFFDKRRLTPVGSLSAVTPGTAYADYSNGNIIIGSDPRSHLVEQTVAPGLIQATVNDVTVANLVIEEAANEAQVGAIDSRTVGSGPNGFGWRILHNNVLLNHGTGIGFAGASVVAGNFIHDQGQLGFGAHGTGSVVTNNEISFNGGAGYMPGWEAGGSKSWETSHETLTHNYVHDNIGPGLWDDGGNIDTTYEYNLIVDNWGAGIQHEISYDATIENNVISGNGFRLHQGWAWDAGIQIQSSGGTRLIDIARNVVVGNYNGITLIDNGNRADNWPTPHGPHILQNVWVHNNTIAVFAGQTTGAVQDQQDPAVFTTSHLRFDANTYYVSSLTSPHFAWANSDVDWSRWRRYGNDRASRAELATAGDLNRIIAAAAAAYHW
jgi:Right handed beta helix region